MNMVREREVGSAIIRHIEAGGVRTLLYGGNANLYHLGRGDYGTLLEFLASNRLRRTAYLLPATWLRPYSWSYRLKARLLAVTGLK